MNDLNNWNQKWAIEDLASGGAVCLNGQPMSPVKAEDPDPWSFDLDQEAQGESQESTSVDIKARLWSRKIPAKVGMQCLTLTYSLSLGGRPSNDVSLALLQRQEG